MSKPTAGKQYIVQVGDTFESISKKAYGDSVYAKNIINSNQGDLIPGKSIIVPLINSRAILKDISGKSEKDLTVMIENRELYVDSASVVRSIDAGAYGFKAVYSWTPKADPEIDNLLLQYRYPNLRVFIGNENILSGILYESSPELLTNGRIKNLSGASYTADAIDSTLKPPYERNNLTLDQLGRELLEPVGIGLDVETDTGGKFDRITANPNDTIFGHLSKFATQRGFLVSTNPKGNMVYRTANVNGSPVDYLEEGDGVVTAWSARFNGRARFNTYRAIGQSPGDNAKPYIAFDEKVPRSRSLTFEHDDTTKGDIKKAAEWKRSKALADALSIELPVNSWFDSSGKLWKENTIVTVKSETFSVKNGFNFLIRSVQNNLSENGETGILTIVPPQVYTGEKLEEPWQ